MTRPTLLFFYFPLGSLKRGVLQRIYNHRHRRTSSWELEQVTVGSAANHSGYCRVCRTVLSITPEHPKATLLDWGIWPPCSSFVSSDSQKVVWEVEIQWWFIFMSEVAKCSVPCEPGTKQYQQAICSSLPGHLLQRIDHRSFHLFHRVFVNFCCSLSYMNAGSYLQLALGGFNSINR